MSNRNLALRAAIVLSVSSLCTPLSARALDWSDTQRPLPADSVAAPQVKWVIDANADALSEVVEIRERVPSAMMAYRFRVEVTFAGADDASMGVPQWQATLRRGQEEKGVVRGFTNDSPDWRLTSLYGVMLAANEQLVLTVSLPKAETRKVVVRLTIDHEQLGRPHGRRAIHPFLTAVGTRDDSTSVIYEWQSEVDGYLVGIADLWRPNSAEVRMIDVQTGATVWGDSPRGRASFEAATSKGVESIYVEQEAGHSYLLIVTPRANARIESVQRGATMMVATRRGTN